MANDLPLAFACSGCSHAGQLANQVALELDRLGVAQMSCLAGVGAAKRHFLNQLAERDVWVIDGCPIECSLGVFEQVREQVDVHIRLHEFGLKKNDPPPTGEAFQRLIAEIREAITHPRCRNTSDSASTPESQSG